MIISKKVSKTEENQAKLSWAGQLLFTMISNKYNPD